MKKHLLTITLLAVAFTRAAVCQSPLESPSPFPSATPTPTAFSSPHPAPSVCLKSSWSPEVHTFYGAKDVITEKLATLSQPSEHRVFVQITQGDSKGNVRLYEKQEDGRYSVTEWSPRETSALLTEIDEAIMANKGQNCVGEQIKGVLKNLGEAKVHKDVAVPVSPQAAFAHPVKEAPGEYIKTAIINGC